MVNQFRQVVSAYINQNSKEKNWEEIRELFSVYSYVAFLLVAIKNTTGKVDRVKERAISLGLESKDNLNLLFSYPATENIAEEIARIIDDETQIDINAVYQAYLSVDYRMCNNFVEFSGGKNSRDTLGSYYTQEEFAHEITKKAIDEYLVNCITNPNIISVADFSCGGGAFLIAAYKVCKDYGIKVKLVGVDVDPIATMITRSRLIEEHVGNDAQHIILGNPLLTVSNSQKSTKAFSMALSGRYYNSDLAIDISESYDVVIGNPPWEKIRFEEKKFLSHYMDTHLIASKKNRENAVNNALETNQKFYRSILEDYKTAKEDIKKQEVFIDTRVGELNTYALFTEYALKHISKKGIVGMIVKSSLLKMPVYSKFMKHSMASKKIYEIYMFVNRKKIFNIDSREEFSVVYYSNDNKNDLQIAVDIDDYREFYVKDKITISNEMLGVLNPETGMLPNITSNEELDFLCSVYNNNPTFGNEYTGCRFGRLVHLTNHSQHILREKKTGYLPIYEGKFIELYTGNYATFKGMSENEKYKNKATAIPIDDVTGTEYPEARFFIKSEIWDKLSKKFHEGYIIAWRSLTAATNRRTMLATLIPLIPTCQSIQILQLDNIDDMLQILVLFNSIIFDYIVRLKMAGLDLTQTIIKQIPVPKKEIYESVIVFQDKEDTIRNHVYARIKYLYAKDKRVSALFKNNDICDSANKSRKQIISELDCLVGVMYGLSTEQIKEIANTFEKYYTKKEVEQWF